MGATNSRQVSVCASNNNGLAMYDGLLEASVKLVALCRRTCVGGKCSCFANNLASFIRVTEFRLRHDCLNRGSKIISRSSSTRLLPKAGLHRNAVKLRPVAMLLRICCIPKSFGRYVAQKAFFMQAAIFVSRRNQSRLNPIFWGI